MAKEFLGIYDPFLNEAVVNGKTINGFGTEEAIRTERNVEEDATVKTGLQGDFTFQINPDKSGTIILTLKQNAPDNTFLDDLRVAKIVFPVSIRSNHGGFTEKASATQAMIGTRPRKVFGSEEAELEWSIICGELIERDTAA